MTPELHYLTLVTLFTAVMWLPYVLNTIMVRGIGNAVGYPDNPQPLSAWAQRMKAAHANATENLVVFAALVLIANAIGLASDTVILACKVYFWARVAHYLVYSFGIPWLRTLSFLIALVCQLVIGCEILNAANIW